MHLPSILESLHLQAYTGSSHPTKTYHPAYRGKVNTDRIKKEERTPYQVKACINNAIATFLDPRYKGKFFSDILIKEIKEKLLTALETEENPTASISTGVKPITVRKGHCQNLEESIANILDSDDDDEQSENQLSDTKSNLIIEYMSEKRLPRDQDQLKYWQINIKKFGGLSHIARTYLSSPATSVPSEQFFSAAGIVYDPRRNRLLGDKAAKLLFFEIQFTIT
ncbi:unnamed protein product [Diatraea saccharalis]|uniref:HAT C-terminal dimerisation domain-containing protein n=1 Tax=Diatraea saccharalis TaxID=40085 RepID=A0A9N9RBA3_9NEOP|nr:unnamed protein product [Diatraea saccharalis]